MTPRSPRRALLIGTEHYEDTRFESLPCTREDSSQLSAALRHPAIGGFVQVDILHDLTGQQMRAGIAEFLTSCEENELALLFLTGHGVRLSSTTGEFFFIASDTNFDDIATTGVGAVFVNEMLESCHAAQKVAVLDCCQSGGFALGFRSADGPTAKSAKAATAALQMRPQGVYVLSSSRADQTSWGGGGTAEQPEPSLFTGMIVQTLRTGSAGSSAGTDVTVEALADAVAEKLSSTDQTPVRSTLNVSKSIVIARRPRGAPPELHASPVQPTVPKPRQPSEPNWSQLLDYWYDAVKETSALQLMSLRDAPFACLLGEERLLTGDLDDDDCIAVPDEAAALVRQTTEDGNPLWAGWPIVMMTQKGKRVVAPLLIRQVDIVTDDSGELRLRPEGTVSLHPTLVRELLGTDDADRLMASYQPSWHSGERGRLAADASHLLTQEMDTTVVEELRPEALSDRIPTSGPGDGAYNAAILFSGEDGDYDKKLLKDLTEIATKTARIPGTALAALLRPEEPAPSDRFAAMVPQPANAAQLSVLHSAMSRRLTVATGPPGTGKSQLIVDVVATALAAGQSVLVASTNGGAVNEVWRRCDKLQPGSVIRSGAKKTTEQEIAGLRALLGAAVTPCRSSATNAEQHNLATQRVDEVRRELERAGYLESQLARIGQERAEAARRLGVKPGWQPAADVHRARALTRAPRWLLGEWRRSRLLSRSGLPGEHPDSALTCEMLADYTDSDHSWHRLHQEVLALPSDDEVDDRRRRAQDALAETSVEVLRGTIRDAAVTGAAVIQSLLTAKLTGQGDWRQMPKWLRFARGWAVTCQSARRFRCDPHLFDLVIVDEASQCPTPHVVPLLFRAERALIVGDAMQLPHIAGLSRHRDRELRDRHGIAAVWAEEHQMSVERHSAFKTADRAAGGNLLLDEHFRCHPTIAGLASRLFYGGTLKVLTNQRGRPASKRDAVCWWDAPGSAARRSGSWANAIEAAEVAACVEQLIDELPATAEIGVVTPYRAQARELERLLKDRNDLLSKEKRTPVRIGTVHTFQGGECDVMVFSLVAARNVDAKLFAWFDSQRPLWNVAITRARSNLVVVGDRELWRQRGGVGGELLATAEKSTLTPSWGGAHRTELYHLLQREDPDVELDIVVNGHWADAILRDGTAVLLDAGEASGQNPSVHMERMLKRRTLLANSEGRPARRIPIWRLFETTDARLDGGSHL